MGTGHSHAPNPTIPLFPKHFPVAKRNTSSQRKFKFTQYMLSYGPEVIVVRAILCTLGHVGFSAFWGAALGWTRQQALSNRRILLLGILGAIASHGLYDYFLFVGDPSSGFITLAVVTGLFFVMLNRARAASQSTHASSVALPGMSTVYETGACWGAVLSIVRSQSSRSVNEILRTVQNRSPSACRVLFGMRSEASRA